MSAKAIKPVNQKRERHGSTSPDNNTCFTEGREWSGSYRYTRSAFSSVYIRKHKKQDGFQDIEEPGLERRLPYAYPDGTIYTG